MGFGVIGLHSSSATMWFLPIARYRFRSSTVFHSWAFRKGYHWLFLIMSVLCFILSMDGSGSYDNDQTSKCSRQTTLLTTTFLFVRHNSAPFRIELQIGFPHY